MFFSYQILIRSKNSSFAIIWRYMHERHSQNKVTKQELLKIDIAQACTDLQNYVPTGKLDASEVLNKMSLYLLAQLSYGVTLVLNVQADFLINDLRHLLNSMSRLPEFEVTRKKPTPGTRKKRKAGEIEMADLEKMMEEVLHPEEAEGRKKRRTTAERTTKGPSLLNLSDPRSYIDHQVPTAANRKELSFGGEELRELDEMFMDQSDIRLPPPEWPAFGQTNKTPEEKLTEKLSTTMALLPDTSELGRGRQSAERPQVEHLEDVMGPAVQDDSIGAVGELAEPEPGPVEQLFEPGPELPFEKTRQPIYRRSHEELVEGDGHGLVDDLKLDPLPDLVVTRPPRTGQRRRPAGLIIDERTEMTTEEMVRNVENVSDIIRTMEDLDREELQRQQPSLKDLFKPYPSYITKELYSVFDTVLKDIHERPLTFEEAQRMTEEEMRVRRFDNLEMASMRSESETSSEKQHQRLQESFAIPVQGPDEGGKIASPPPPMEQIREKISIAEPLEYIREKVSVTEPLIPPFDDNAPPLRPSTPLEPEQIRRATEDTMRTRSITEPSAMQFMDESYVQPPMDFSMAEQARADLIDGIEDIQLQRESVLLKSSPDVADEPWLDEEMDQLYNAILEKQNAGERPKPYIFYHELIDPSMTKKQAARRFFTLLKLLKHGKVKAKQKRPYRSIMVRVVGLQSSEMDISTAGEE